jgi:peptide/nickel transport system substrate-binding protein
MNGIEIDGEAVFDVTVETYELSQLQGVVFAPDYSEEASAPLLGLSGTFDPGSYCEATHSSDNIGACCNFQGIAFDDLDQLMDRAKFGQAVLNDTGERASRYDEVWKTIVTRSANSYVDIDLNVVVHANDVVDFSAYPFEERIYRYGLYAPEDAQAARINRG